MIVNVSPADYNIDETFSSLYYATRVKQIVNESVRHFESKELSKMRDQLKAISEDNAKLKRLLNQVTYIWFNCFLTSHITHPKGGAVLREIHEVDDDLRIITNSSINDPNSIIAEDSEPRESFENSSTI